MKKNIRNYNERNQWHGYQQWYKLNTLAFRGNCYNDNYTGYVECHCYAKQTVYRIQ